MKNISDIDIIQLKKKLKMELDLPRYEHTIGVAYTATALAMRYHANMQKALIAGLLHDCAKCFSNQEKIKLCERYGIKMSPEEQKKPSLLHAKLGAEVAKCAYGIDDMEILQAIAYHTTGHPEMSLLDKIIYLADYIEPGRDFAPDLSKVRALAFEDLDACILMVLEDTLTYLNQTKEIIDPMTEQTYLSFKKKERTNHESIY